MSSRVQGQFHQTMLRWCFGWSAAFFKAQLPERDIRVPIDGQMRFYVKGYGRSEGSTWVPAGRTVDRHGRPPSIKSKGTSAGAPRLRQSRATSYRTVPRARSSGQRLRLGLCDAGTVCQRSCPGWLLQTLAAQHSGRGRPHLPLLWLGSAPKDRYAARGTSKSDYQREADICALYWLSGFADPRMRRRGRAVPATIARPERPDQGPVQTSVATAQVMVPPPGAFGVKAIEVVFASMVPATGDTHAPTEFLSGKAAELAWKRFNWVVKAFPSARQARLAARAMYWV